MKHCSRPMWSRSFLISLLWLLAPCAADAEPGPQEDNASDVLAMLDAEGQAEISKGFQLLHAAKPAEAITIFERLIAESDRKYEDDPRRRFCMDDPKDLPAIVAAIGSNRHEVIALNQSVCDAHFGKGFALIDLGRGDLAEPELRLATEMDPSNAHFTNEYAELYKSRREWQKSYDLFTHAWDIVDHAKDGPDAKVAARALRGMGFNKIELDELDEAERLFNQSLEYDPESQLARSELEYIARKKAIGQ